MKHLKQIFQALLGVVALIFTAIIAFGRLTWRTIRNWWKNRSKWLRRSIAAIFIIVPAGFAALVAYVLYENEYGRARHTCNLLGHQYAFDPCDQLTIPIHHRICTNYVSLSVALHITET